MIVLACVVPSKDFSSLVSRTPPVTRTVGVTSNVKLAKAARLIVFAVYCWNAALAC